MDIPLRDYGTFHASEIRIEKSKKKIKFDLYFKIVYSTEPSFLFNSTLGSSIGS